ncbi:MAG: putative RecB family exonuclease [Acidimicrobiia bacterium]|nr:putative RecB family exonuclease [Acidimicrobiia bacterium]
MTATAASEGGSSPEVAWLAGGQPAQADQTESMEGAPVPAHLSPTSAATFVQCPRRWKLRYVDRLPDPPGLPAMVGTLAHRVLEELLNEPSHNRNPERARQLAGQVWPQHAAHPEFVQLGLDADGQRAYKWRVWRAIEGLWHLEDPAEVSVLATEQRIEVMVGGVPFVGIVDRVDHHAEGVVITDYKSGQPPHPRRVDEKLDQVLLYAAAVASATGERPVAARLLYLGATVIEIEATPAAIERAVGRLTETWQGLQAARENDDYPPRTGPLCAWCPYLEQCAEGQAELRARTSSGWVLPPHAPAAAFRHVA